jgi:hypothetical protein
MGSTLAAIGRAQPSRNMFQLLDAKLAIDQGERREALTGAQVNQMNQNAAYRSEMTDRMKSENRQEAERQQYLNTKVPVSTLTDQMYGGPDGPFAKMMVKTATGMHFIDEFGLISNKNQERMHKIISEPAYAYNLGVELAKYDEGLWQQSKKQLTEAKQALAEKPDDEKLKQTIMQLEQATDQARLKYDASAGLLPGVKEELDRKIEQEKIAARASKTDTVDKTKIKMHKGDLEVEVPMYKVDKYKAAGWKEGQKSSSGKGGKNSPEKDRAKAILTLNNQVSNRRSGVDMMSDVMESERPAVIKEDQKRLDIMKQEFIKDFGEETARNLIGVVLEDDKKEPDNAMDRLPPAKEHKNQVARDTETGKRYDSDGKEWKEIKK